MGLSFSSNEEVDFEYHVTLPSNTTSANIKVPVVLLLGWTGCRDKDLSKYSALYEKKGCISIRYIPSPKDVFINPKKFQKVALKLLELIPHLELEDHPLFFHMFSNGGCSVYRYTTKAICSNPANELQIRGCIFDSAPAVVTIAGTTTAISNSLQGSRIFKMFFITCTWLYLATAGSLEYLVSLITHRQREAFCIGIWEDLCRDDLRCPQLALYSKADDICPADSITKFVEERKKLGVNMMGVCWEESLHVRHYVMYPEMYTQQVHTFIDLCLKNENENENENDEK